ncbi:LytR/AlgR family response regulator transcription factor [Salmonirosea aquatica]|uniref:HTH LytTR-type domain-containing protein n=1 Tax=Salmonirosea aquatica TaxID=2654236 RepID=A0A7C9B9V3_9BACT|nr:hypothetical protein [Cytophagaceae bacterium SJW1-29]
MNHFSLSQHPGVHIGAHTRVQITEIVYCEGDRNYTHVHFVRRPKLTLSVTMRVLHERLGEQGFLRISRSAVVNLDYIAHYDSRQVILRNGLALPIARRRRKQVQSALESIF